MRIKRTYKIDSYIDKTIKKGDNVMLTDGSALTINRDKHPNVRKDLYIVNAYPELGMHLILKSYVWKVVETDVKDRVADGVIDNVYLQDIIIEAHGLQLRTSSGMVRKV